LFLSRVESGSVLALCCAAMPSGNMIEFRANGRVAPGYLSMPPSGKGPGLVVVQEWWGLLPHIKDVANRFAAEGFVVLAPDLYHGESTTSPDEAGRKLMALDIDKAGQDLQGAATHLLGLSAVEPRKVGVVGFCMGGQLALYAAAAQGEVFEAAVDFYGIHPNAKVDFAKLKRPVQAHFGKSDEFVKEADARELVAKIEAAGADIDAHFYDAGHAFFNDSRPEAYDEGPATQAWERTLAFFRKHLA
jgi:carboxymethylenebutenolidase